MRSRAIPLCLVALAAALVPAGAPAHPGHAATVVEVRDDSLSGRYAPRRVTVVQGDDVFWLWKGQVRNHSVTAEANQDEQFDSDPGKAPGEISQPAGRQFTHRFGQLGTYAYFCKVHPGMRGEVEVVSASGLSDTTAPRFLRAGVPRRGRLRLRMSERADVLARLIRAGRAIRTFDFSVRKGLNVKRFRTRGLEPGRYRLRLTAFDLADNSSRPRVVRFRIPPG